ncbi:MAG: hypothetical protein ABF391_15550 [Akkermansiaceae bacterium]
MELPELTRNRFAIIERAIKRNGGEISTRCLQRNCGITRWEIESGVVVGLFTIHLKKPPVGRPRRKIRNVSDSDPTKLPPPPSILEKSIPQSYWIFARLRVGELFGRSQFGIKLPVWGLYSTAFQRCRSASGARASSSRLLKNPQMQAAIAWVLLEMAEPEADEKPTSPLDIWLTIWEQFPERREFIPPLVRHIFGGKGEAGQ